MPAASLVRGVYLIRLTAAEMGAGGFDDVEASLRELFRALPEGIRGVLLDMEGVSLLRSSGLGALLSLCEQLKPRGIRLAVCRVPSFGRNLFKISGLDQYLLVFATVEDGLNALGWGDAESADVPEA